MGQVIAAQNKKERGPRNEGSLEPRISRCALKDQPTE